LRPHSSLEERKGQAAVGGAATARIRELAREGEGCLRLHSATSIRRVGRRTFVVVLRRSVGCCVGDKEGEEVKGS